jgi:hypothetical protein
MPYIKQTWVDGEDGETPISAARLGHLEDGIGDAHDAVLQLSTDTTAALTGKADTTYVDAIGTAAQTPNTIVRRDGAGGFAGADISINNQPTSAWHATRKDYVDALGTASTVADTVVRRDVNGNTRATGFYAEAAPAFADALTRKDYVDALGTDTATASTVVRRDANGWFKAWGVELFGTADNREQRRPQGLRRLGDRRCGRWRQRR